MKVYQLMAKGLLDSFDGFNSFDSRKIFRSSEEAHEYIEEFKGIVTGANLTLEEKLNELFLLKDDDNLVVFIRELELV